MTTSLSGCFGEQKVDDVGITTPYDIYPEPWERSEMQYIDTDIYSRVTINGSYDIDAVQSIFVVCASLGSPQPRFCLGNGTVPDIEPKCPVLTSPRNRKRDDLGNRRDRKMWH